MAYTKQSSRKKKHKEVPKGMPKRLDNPNSDYVRKTDHKLGKQTAQYIAKEDFEKMLQLALVHMEKASNEKERYQWYRNYIIMMIGVNLGFRTNTIAELTRRDLSGGRIRVKEHKNGKIFTSEMTAKLKKVIDEYFSAYNFTANEYLFRSSKKFMDPDEKMRPIQRGTIWYFMNNKGATPGLAAEAGIDYVVSAYSLRKSYARWVYDDTHDIFKVMRLLKHSDPMITARYIGLEEDEITALRAKIEYGFEKFGV